MDRENWKKERIEWFEKYGIPYDDFRLGYCVREHVSICPIENEQFLYLSFDGTIKSKNQLTEEELKDLENELNKIPERVKQFVENLKTKKDDDYIENDIER